MGKDEEVLVRGFKGEPLIVRSADTLGGKPRIAGTRLSTEWAYSLATQDEWSVDRILVEYPHLVEHAGSPARAAYLLGIAAGYEIFRRRRSSSGPGGAAADG